ncbi:MULTISPECIES: hypothetical protein [unclassified Streptomyces]|uniref:hypothetical protein n=1 Tax=unclassified Streptomyces TaxID=2593676 RepID=UPI0033A6C225
MITRTSRPAKGRLSASLTEADSDADTESDPDTDALVRACTDSGAAGPAEAGPGLAPPCDRARDAMASGARASRIDGRPAAGAALGATGGGGSAGAVSPNAGRKVTYLTSLGGVTAGVMEVPVASAAGGVSVLPVVVASPGPEQARTGLPLRGERRCAVRRKKRDDAAGRGDAHGRYGAEAHAGTVLRLTSLATVVLALCGAVHFPLHRHGQPADVYGLALAMSGACLVSALLLAVRPSRTALCAAVVVPAALAGVQALSGRLGAPGLVRSLGLTLAASWLASAVAVLAAATALAALLVLARVPGERRVATPT